MANITKDSKVWWNENYQRNLKTYRESKHLEDWKNFKKVVKNTKWEFLMPNTRNFEQEERSLDAYELCQDKKASNCQSNQT